MKNHSKSKKSWLILIISDDERKGPYEISKRMIVSLIAVVIVSVALILLACFYQYSSQKNAYHKLSSLYDGMKETCRVVSDENRELTRRIDLLRNQLDSTQTTAKTSPEPIGNGTGAATAEEASGNEQVPVAIDKFHYIFDADAESLHFKFMISNQLTGDDTISGYVFVLLAPVSSGGTAISYPHADFENGQPLNYKQGEYFSIARFKYMEGTFVSIGDEENFTEMTVLVFSRDGNLILTKNLVL